MGLLNKFLDSAVALTTGQETVRIPYDALAKIVQEEFVVGSDDTYLEQVRKTAKGGVFFPKELLSENGRYTLRVGAFQRGFWLLRSKAAWILDNEQNKFYQLDKDRRWSKFYAAVDTAVKMEMINRDR